MRVIAGEAKGRRLKSVPGVSTRPITDRVKESLFDILGAEVVGARVLDLYAGTGSVGIEALSRGAEEVVFVDAGRRAIEVIKANLALTGLGEEAKVFQQDVFRFLRKTDLGPFDIIYVAPPQYKELWSKTVKVVDESPNILNADGLVIAQMHPKEYEELSLETLRLLERRKYGSTLLCFYGWISRRS